MKKTIKSLLLFAFLFTLNACKDDEPPLPDNLVQFETPETGFEDTEQELTIKLKLSRAVDQATPVTLDLTTAAIQYGTDFTTVPAAENNQITLTIPAASSEASLKISKSASLFLSGDETISFKIKTVGAPVLAGSNTECIVKFAPIVSSGTTLQLNGIKNDESGASALNSVFVDFSNNQQIPVARNSWDLGFFAGNEFRVILNNTTSATARVLNKTDLAAVTAADTIPAASWSLGFTEESFALIDDVEGDLSKTLIAEIAANDNDNKVYILNPGTGGGVAARPWYKIRIIRKGSNGYTLQYAGITETTFKTLDIEKDASYNFNYVSLGTTASAVSVEPAKDKWDIKWSFQMSKTASGSSFIPYAFSDLVITNTNGGVQAAEILTESVSYENFSESNLSAVTLSSDAFTIGANWRATTGTIGVKTDRFYVIKDAAGNVYKLKFINFHASDGGERGKPKLEFKLVKKG